MPKVLLASMLQYGTVSISIPCFHNTVITTNHITDSRYASISQSACGGRGTGSLSASTPAKRRIMDPMELLLRDGEES
jgi:hypothetical protein